MPQPQFFSRSFFSAAGVVAVITLLTRLVGLVREQVNAAVFGVGSVYGAFQYAGLVPFLFLVILGGLNGPLHSAVVTVLAGRSPAKANSIIKTLSVSIGIILAVISGMLFLFAPQWIDLIAPGLTAMPTERSLAILQLRIMAPVAWYGGMTGLSIGILTTAKNFWLPTLTPILSSLTMIAGVTLWAQQSDRALNLPATAQTGAMVLAGSVLIGAILQWLVQWLAQRSLWLTQGQGQWSWRDPDTRGAFRLIGIALLLVGMVQANWYIDLAFTSWLPEPGEAASALTFASLLAQAPQGIVINVLLVPWLPLLARSARAEATVEMQNSLQQAFYLVTRLTLVMSALMTALAVPVVTVVYERGAFDQNDTSLVGAVLFAYALGLGFSVARELLTRVFYVLHANRFLLWLGFGGLGLNISFNWLLYRPLGVVGLALSSGIVNLVVVLLMLTWLNRRFRGWLSRQDLMTLLKLAITHVVIGMLTWKVHGLLPETQLLFEQLVGLAIATLFGLGLSLLAQQWMKFEEV